MRTGHKHFLRSSSALLAASIFSASVPAYARQATYSFNIPSQNLADALAKFGKATKHQIVYDGRAARRGTSTALIGTYTAEGGLRRLLGGSGFAMRVGRAGVLIVEPTTAQTAPSSTQEDAASGPEDQSVGGVNQEALAVSEILVTGRRTLNVDVRRSEDDPQPYVVFDQETIRRSSAQNVETFLRDRLPMNAGGTPNGLRVTQLGAQSRVNLRSLGTGQTLILINGRRQTPGASTGGAPLQPDLNGIPLGAIERIEVLPATASGIYGGGATGGVINIVLRDNYTGAEIKFMHGSAFDGAAPEHRIDFSLGFNPGSRTNILLTGSYYDQDAMLLGDRSELVSRYYDIARANAPALLMPPANPPLGATPNIRSVDGTNLILDDGTPLGAAYTSIPAGYAGTLSDNGRALVANAGNYDLGLAQSSQFITGAKTQILGAPTNKSARLSIQHEFTPRLRVFLEGSVSENRARGVTTASIGSATSPLRISAGAPNNPFTTDILVTVPTDSFDFELETKVSQLRLAGGVIVGLPGNWQAAADYSWGRSINNQGGRTGIPGAALSAAVLNGSLDVLKDLQGAPLDLSSFLSYPPVEGRLVTDLRTAALRIGGPLFVLPAGAVTLSSILEYRDEQFNEATTSLNGSTIFFPSRSQNVASVYGEIKIPLFSSKNAQAGFHALEMQLAGRFDRYQVNGATGFLPAGSTDPVVRTRNETSTFSPTVAIRYQPIEGVILRASYGTGFVPPDVSQLAPTIYPAPLSVIDPLRGGATTVLPIGQILYLGNPNLTPEKSNSISLGLVLTPRFVGGLRISADYTRIRKTHNIAAYPTSIQGLVDDETLFPDRITRGPNLSGDPAGWPGPITAIDFTYFNISRAKVEALDVQLDYTRETPIGTFTLASVATWQLTYETEALAGQPVIDNVGLTYNNAQRFIGNAELRWSKGGWTAGWLARHYASYWTANPDAPSSAAALALQGNGGRVPAQTYHDFFVSWSLDSQNANAPAWLRGAEVQLSVRNVFDKLPPFDANFYNVFRTFHSPVGDARGATYQLSLTKRF